MQPIQMRLPEPEAGQRRVESRFAGAKGGIQHIWVIAHWVMMTSFFIVFSFKFQEVARITFKREKCVIKP